MMYVTVVCRFWYMLFWYWKITGLTKTELHLVFCVEVECYILVRTGIDRGCLRMVQGIVFRPKDEEVLEFGENYVMRSCMSCVLHLILMEADFSRMRWSGLVAHVVDTRNAFVVGNPEVWRHVEWPTIDSRDRMAGSGIVSSGLGWHLAKIVMKGGEFTQ